MELNIKVTLDHEQVTKLLIESDTFEFMWNGRPEAYDGFQPTVRANKIQAIKACRTAVKALTGETPGLGLVKRTFDEHYGTGPLIKNTPYATQHPTVVTWDTNSEPTNY